MKPSPNGLSIFSFQGEAPAHFRGNHASFAAKLKLVAHPVGNTRPKVSCEGIPLGNCNNSVSQAPFAFPNSSMPTHPSAPQITPQMAMMIISRKRCNLVRSIRGSSTCAKIVSRARRSRSSILSFPLFSSYSITSSPFRCNCPVMPPSLYPN